MKQAAVIIASRFGGKDKIPKVDGFGKPKNMANTSCG